MGLNWYTTDPTLQATMAYYLQPDELAVAEPHLTRIGELMGGPVARWAEETDRNPPRLERYDRWGHDVSRVVMPTSFAESRRAVLDAQQALRDDARRAGVNSSLTVFASNYLLNQADIGMGCALGTGGGMVKSLVAAYAPPDVRDHVLAKFESGEWEGETAQLLTERTGGSDLGALETTATRDGDAWLLNGFKWFASNCNGEAFVVLAKPEGAPDSSRGVATFLVLRTRRDGSRNGVRVRRLKDKLGTRSVASGEIEFVDAEAFLLSGEASDDAGPSDGKGLGRMMELTNAARLGIALFALGNARRALVESLCYARRRQAFGDALIDKPLMRRKLAEMIVDVEAAQALVFDGTGAANHRQPRQGAPAHRRARHQAEGLPARHHHGVRRDRNPWRQRLYRDLAGGPAAARRAGEHHLGGARQHPLPRRAARDRTGTGARAAAGSACMTRCRCPTMTTRPPWYPDGCRISTPPSPPGPNWTVPLPRRDSSRSLSSWAMCTPGRCWPSRPPGSERRAEVRAKRLSPGCIRSGTWSIAVRFAVLTPRATRRSSVSTN